MVDCGDISKLSKIVSNHSAEVKRRRGFSTENLNSWNSNEAKCDQTQGLNRNEITSKIDWAMCVCVSARARLTERTRTPNENHSPQPDMLEKFVLISIIYGWNYVHVSVVNTKINSLRFKVLSIQ